MGTKYLTLADPSVTTFDPGSGLPTLAKGYSTAIDDAQLDALIAKAQASDIRFITSLAPLGPLFPGPRPPTPDLLANFYAELETLLGEVNDLIGGTSGGLVSTGPQTLTLAQKQQARLNIAASPDLGIFLVDAPTGTAATDIAAVNAALASSKPIKLLQTGTYNLVGIGSAVVGNAQLLQGQGAGFNYLYAPTKLTLGAGDTIEFQGGGGRSGGFCIDGNNASTKPLRRTGGTGGSMRTFEDLSVWNSAQDCAEMVDAQNDLWTMCTFGNAVRDLIYMDKSYGGAHFLRCELTTSGRYHVYADNTQGTGSAGYLQPTDVQFVGGIFEGAVGTSLLKLGHTFKFRFHGTSFFTSSTTPSGPLFDLTNAPSTSFVDCWVKISTTYQSGSIGWKISNASSLTLAGCIATDGLGTIVQIDGGSAYVYGAGAIENYSPLATFFGTINSGSASQALTLNRGSQSWAAQTPTDPILLSQNSARTFNKWQMDANGLMKWGPGTSTSYDTWLSRLGVGVLGTTAQQILATGAGTTAQRPTANIIGSLYYDTDLDALISRNASSWRAALMNNGTATQGYIMQAGASSAYAWASGANRPTTIVATGGAAQTVNPAVAGVYAIALTANLTVTLSATGLTNQVDAECEIEFVQGASPWTVTFSPAVKWAGGVAYTPSTGVGAIDRVRVHTRNAGSTWFGEVLGKAYA
jgi:hypothetical protein